MGHVAENFESLIATPSLISMQAATQRKTISRSEQASIIRVNDEAIAKLASRYSGPCADKQDLIQEGRIALLHAAETYDDSFGVPLIGYARRFIAGAMLRLVNCELNQPSRPAGNEHSDDEGTSHSSPELDVQSAEILAKLARVMLTLDESERQILRAFYFEDKGLKTIAEELGVSIGKAHYLFHSALTILTERVEAQL